jgi:signal transduction histidine kinase
VDDAALVDHEPSLWHGLRLGLRTRIALAVTLVTLVLSTAVSLITLAVARETLLDAREQSATRRALANASVIAGQNLSELDAADLQTTLSSLSEAGRPSVVWDGGTRTVSLDPRTSVEDLPDALVTEALEERRGAIMRFTTGGQTLVGVGVPVADQDAAYFEVFALDDISDALRTIGTSLLAAVAGSTLAAALLGFWLSRYTIRPITRLSEAVEAVSLGQLDTRMDVAEYDHDPDLAPLVANFNAMVQALQERINRDARFASDVSHELRSPLTTLNAGVQVLANNRDEMPERAQQALDLLDSDVERFTQLVEDLLEISRFDAGAVRLELDDVALVPMVRSTVDNLTGGSVPVVADPALDDLVLACDRRRLARILANFLNNAEKYADGATEVSVERHDPDPEDPLGEPTVRIAVEDGGPGVPPEQREAIFDRFNRGDQGGSRGADVGVGLGLALAAEHARLQAGRVWVEDRAAGGQGARFVVELPLLEVRTEDEDLAEATPEAASALTLTGEHKAVTLTGPEDDR